MEIERDLMSVVAHNPILRACSEETRQALFDRGMLHSFESGALLFADDEPGHRLLFLLRGALQMGKATSRGRRQIICCPDASMCGGLCLLFFGARGLAEIRSLEPGQLLVVERDEFERLTHQDPAFGRAAWDSAADCMAHLNNLVTQLSFNKVAERVVTLLLDATSQDGDLIRLTQSDLAASVGTTREVVARCLAGLQSEGLIRLGRARVTVLDREGLRNEL
jgi:CRP/FNR family cyclic AMP-dependent transcriptional regulator